MRPIQEVSGDFYDHFELPDGTIAFAIGDVSGKGLNASLLMSQTASLFRCLGKTVRDPARLMSILNREICATVSRGMFVTMVAGLYDPATGRLRFANAGHICRRCCAGRTSARSRCRPTARRSALCPTRNSNRRGATSTARSSSCAPTASPNSASATEELGTQGLDMLLEPRAASRCCSASTPWSTSCSAPAGASRDDLTLLAIDDCMAARWSSSGAESERAGPDPSDFLFGLSFPADPKRLKLVRPAIRAAAEACGFRRK